MLPRRSVPSIALITVFSLSLIAAAARGHAQPNPGIEIVPLVPNASEVNELAVTPDGRFLISAGLTGSVRDGRPRLWEAATGRLLRIFDTAGPNKWDSNSWGAMAVSPNRPHVAVIGPRGIEIWDLTTAKLVRRFRDPIADLQSIAFTADGRFVVSGGTDKIEIWEADTGKRVRVLAGHKAAVSGVAVTPDAKFVVSGGEDKTVRVWRFETGRLERVLRGHTSAVSVIRVTADGRHIVSAGGDASKALKLWDFKTGRLIREFEDGNVQRVAVTPDGRRAVTASIPLGDDRTRHKLNLWDLATGKKIKTVGEDYTHHREDMVIFPDGRRVGQGRRSNKITIFDLETDKVIREIEPPGLYPTAFRMSPDGGQVVWVTADNKLDVWDLRSGQLVRRLEDPAGAIFALAISPDGGQLVAAGPDQPFAVWDLKTGRIVRTFGRKQEGDQRERIDFSPDGRHLIARGTIWDFQGGTAMQSFVSFTADGRVLLNHGRGLPHRHANRNWQLWDIDQRNVVRSTWGRGNIQLLHGTDAVSFDCDDEHARVVTWDTLTGREIRTFEADFPCSISSSFYFTPDGSHAVVSTVWGDLALLDLVEGRLARRFEGHANEIYAVEISRDGRRIVSSGRDGVKIWSSDSSAPLATVLGVDSGQWLTISPSGFFAGTPKGSELVSIVRGLDVFNPEQMYQSLYAPDLVRETLADDPDGEVKRAASVLNLERVLDSGRAPEVSLLSPAGGGASSDEVITAQARITDAGGGIGRVEWRVNGVTVGVASAPGSGTQGIVTQTLALEPGANTIEVVAYNSRNLLAALPVSATVDWTAPADQPRPKLFVIAVGINDYADTVFRRLTHAVADAKAFGAAMQAAGAGLYAEVDVTYLLDADATAERIERAIDAVGARMHPRDVFIFLAAAHGKSENGRFHLIPQDYRTLPGRALTHGAIGQERLQDWFANRIKARRGLILLDTCESGALVAGLPSGTDAASSEAALGRLNEATGRPVLTAAAADQAALEGYNGHGVFTYALLDALINGDTNGNGRIELSELAAHIQTLAPRLSREMRGGPAVAQKSRGFIAVGDAPIAARYAGSRQTPRTGSRGEDFPLVNRLPALPTGEKQ